jgi:hypothetical protein
MAPGVCQPISLLFIMAAAQIRAARRATARLLQLKMIRREQCAYALLAPLM